MLTLIVLAVTFVIAWGLVDFGFELAGESKPARVLVGVLAVASGMAIPYAAVETIRAGFDGDEA